MISFQRERNGDRENNCVVFSCRRGNCQLFPVPHKGSKVFSKWTKLLELNGRPGYKICGDHFKPEDFLFREIVFIDTLEIVFNDHLFFSKTDKVKNHGYSVGSANAD